MKANSFVRVAKLDELSGDGPFAVTANGADLALVRTTSGWRAFAGRCPHQGALLGEGEIDGDALVCRNHRWRFALDTGRREGGPECLASFPAIERDDHVLVDVGGSAHASTRAAENRPLDALPGPRGLPLLGNVHQIDPTRMHLILERWAAQYGSTYQFRLGMRRIVVTSDPAMIDEILRERPETYRRDARSDAILTEMGTRSVFNAEGEPWRRQRKLTIAALAQRHLKGLFPSIRTVAERLKRRWDRLAASGDAVDVVEELKRFTVDVTMLIVFGHDANTVEETDDPIQRDLEVLLPTLNRRLFAAVPLWRIVKTPSDRRFEQAQRNVRGWLGARMAETRARLASNPERAERPSNFVEAMVSTTDDEGRPFEDIVIISNLETMLVAGEDTTAFTLAWAIHELCQAPAWAEAVRREADQALGAAAAADAFETANRLATAGAVVDETMRLRSVAPLGFFDANAETALGGYFVPKGTNFIVAQRPAMRDAANFADPLAFRPDRWLGPPTGAHDPSVFIPFGSGPRICPGRALALIEMKALLSMLYKNFDVERVGRAEDVREQFGFTMSPAGLRVRLRPRAA